MKMKVLYNLQMIPVFLKNINNYFLVINDSEESSFGFYGKPKFDLINNQ